MKISIAAIARRQLQSIRRRLRRKARMWLFSLSAIATSCVVSQARRERVQVPHIVRQVANTIDPVVRANRARCGAELFPPPHTPDPYGNLEFLWLPPATVPGFIPWEEEVLFMGGPLAGARIQFVKLKLDETGVRIAGSTYVFMRPEASREFGRIFLQWLHVT
jgi:hypothetical protein